ncbi:hypothetical protein L1765_05230 [Microaerobacter geothermalis]|uniref:hypothetical protein n=1 Tax=Microaerobacter geothermalis TaxID=674972 RepID=UPI001F1C0853|nr:hypothetical protein [Microaerobacter geothermalis]MCF6093399.1 hypothetical protein [Microaerobacter geothermalis]
MIFFILFLLAVYGLTSIVIQLISYFQWGFHPTTTKHYTLLIYQSQRNIEAVMRSLYSWSRLKGIPISITIIDFGSTDDSLKIVQRLLIKFNFQQVNWEYRSMEERFLPADHFLLKENCVLIDVRGACHLPDFVELCRNV